MLLVIILAAILAPKGGGAATYYVDAVNGNDHNIGTSLNSAWKTLNKINASTFSPADKILFKRDQSWDGRLVMRASGAINKPITLGAYGTGSKPVINGDNIYYAVLLDGTSYIIMQNLEIINSMGQGLLIYEGQVNGQIAIVSCLIHNNLKNGITIKDRGNVIIKNSRIYANGWSGISVYYSNDTGSWSDIIGDNIELVNNEIFNNVKHGVYLAGNNAIIKHNTLYSNGSENLSHNLYLIGDNSIVEGNNFCYAYNMGIRYEGSNMIFRYNFF